MECPGDSLIDPVTRKFRPGIARRYTPERWSDVALRSPLRAETNIRIGQGSDKTSYYISLGYLDDKGYQIETSFQRYTATLNLSHKIKDWLSGGVNINYGYTDFINNGQTSAADNIFSFLDNIPPIYPVYLRDASGSLIPDKYYGGNQYDFGRGRGYASLVNPIAEARFSSIDRKSHNVTGSFNLNVAFTKWLILENRLGAQYGSSLQTYFQNPFYGRSASEGGRINKSNGEFFSYNILNLLRFTHAFGKHNIEIAAAHEFNYNETRSLSGSKNNLALPFIRDFNNAVVTNPSSSFTDESAIESYFMQINYDYNGKYFLSATLRRDGSSIFLKNKWGNFGSIGFAWAVHKERFMSGQHVFSHLKLKASYGSIGNQTLGSLYSGYDAYSANNLNGSPVISFSSKGNPDLTWETSRTFQVGTEFGIKRYLDVAVDYYYRLTDNLLYSRTVGISSGYESILTNEGAILNRGVEFDVTGHIVDKKSWLLDVSINGQFLSSSYDHLPIDPATGKEKKLNTFSYFAASRGSGLYDYYLPEWAGVDPQTGAPMWKMYYDDTNRDNVAQEKEIISSLHVYQLKGKDKEGKDSSLIQKTTTYKYGDATRSYVGKSAIPVVSGAINISARYKGISLRIQFIYSLGGYAYDRAYAALVRNPYAGSNNYSVDIRERWQKEGDITDIPRIVSAYGEDQSAGSSSTRFLIRSDYLQLNNVRIGYTLPTKLSKAIKIEQIDIWASGDNLFAFTARLGFVPYATQTGETSSYTYAPLSTFSFGIKLKF